MTSTVRYFFVVVVYFSQFEYFRMNGGIRLNDVHHLPLRYIKTVLLCEDGQVFEQDDVMVQISCVARVNEWEREAERKLVMLLPTMRRVLILYFFFVLYV